MLMLAFASPSHPPASNCSWPAVHVPTPQPVLCIVCPRACWPFAGITTNGIVQLLAFCLFEVCVGMFWPSMMSMRAQYVPEEMRSTIINLFRYAHATRFVIEVMSVAAGGIFGDVVFTA